MRRRIYLHGSLKEIHPDPIEVDADTVAEAIKLVTLLLPGFKPNAKTGYRRIQVLGYDFVEDFFKKDDTVDIHIYPQFNGGKRGGFLQILLGAALIAASFLIGGPFAPLMLRMGVLLVIGGLMQLLQQPPRDNKQEEQTNKSRYLGAPKNTVEIGTRIPILYGRRKVGGHYLSFNVSAVDGII